MDMLKRTDRETRRDLKARIIALGCPPEIAAHVAGLCKTEIRREVRAALAAVADLLSTPSGRRRLSGE